MCSGNFRVCNCLVCLADRSICELMDCLNIKILLIVSIGRMPRGNVYLCHFKTTNSLVCDSNPHNLFTYNISVRSIRNLFLNMKLYIQCTD